MSVSPPRRRVAISIDNLGPPRRAGRSPPWDPPSGQWQPGPGGQSPPHTWHLEDCGRSPWRHWPPPLRYFGGPPPGRDPLRPDLRDALPLPQPRYPGEWEPGRRSPPLRHLARGPFDRSRSPGRERRVAHSPGWPSRDAPPAHIHLGSLSYRRRSSPPRRSISPAFIDSRLPLRPRRVSVERRGAAEAGVERRQRHIGTSPAARRRSAERKPESRVPASKSSRLQVSSSSKEAAVRERPGEGTAGRSNDGKHGSRAADPPCAEKKEERKDEKASGASGEKRSAEKRAGPEQAARAGLPASAHEIVGEAEDRKGNASEKELKAGGTLAAQSDNKPNSSPAGATQQQKASDAGADRPSFNKAVLAEGPPKHSFVIAQPRAFSIPLRKLQLLYQGQQQTRQCSRILRKGQAQPGRAMQGRQHLLPQQGCGVRTQLRRRWRLLTSLAMGTQPNHRESKRLMQRQRAGIRAASPPECHWSLPRQKAARQAVQGMQHGEGRIAAGRRQPKVPSLSL